MFIKLFVKFRTERTAYFAATTEDDPSWDRPGASSGLDTRISNEVPHSPHI